MTDYKQLVNGYFDNELTADQAKELSAWITASPENAEYFAREAQKHRGLRDIFVSGKAEPAQAPVSKRSARAGKRGRTAKRFRPGWLISAAAACIAIIIGSHVINRKQEAVIPDMIRARLIESAPGTEIERDGNTVPGYSGMELMVGDNIRGGEDDTFLELVSEATAVRIGPGAHLNIPSGKEKTFFLGKGDIRCIVAPQEEGDTFTVKTREAEVSVVGTVFSVECRSAHSLISVEEGTVRVSAAGGTAELVHSGETVDVSNGTVAAVTAPEPVPGPEPAIQPESDIKPEPEPEPALVWKTVLTDDFSEANRNAWEYWENFSENTGTVVDPGILYWKPEYSNGFLKLAGKNNVNKTWLQAALLSRAVYNLKNPLRITLEFVQPEFKPDKRFYAALRLRDSRTSNLTDAPQVMFMTSELRERISFNNSADTYVWAATKRPAAGSTRRLVLEISRDYLTAYLDERKILDNYKVRIWLNNVIVQLDAGSRDNNDYCYIRFNSIKIEQYLPAEQDGSEAAE